MKTSRLLSASFIGLVISKFIPLEFDSTHIREAVKTWSTVAIIVLPYIWILRELVNESDSTKRVIRSVIFMIPISLLFLVAVFLAVDLYSWEDRRHTYVQVEGEATVQERAINCGATTDYSYQYYYVQSLGPVFNFVWKVDTAQLDKKKWTRVMRRDVAEESIH